MANKKIKGITIEIGADTLGLDEALKGVEKKSKNAASELREVDRTIKTAGDSVTLWKQKQELLNDALKGSKEKLQLLEDAQKEVNKQFRDKEISEEQYRAFQREVEYARSAVDKYEKQLADAKEKVAELGKSSDVAGDEIKEFGNEAEDAGYKAQKVSDGGLTAMKVALGTLIAEGLKAAGRELEDFTTEVVKTGMTFESSMSNVAAISKASASELEQLKAEAKELGATTRYTAAESADAFGYMALAGWKVEDMLSGIDGVLSLAAASNMDLAQASDIVTDYLTAFGLTAQDSSHFVDMMTYAMANSNTTTALLGEAYKNCAATAASMGYSAEETTAVLMTMANAGVKGGEAGTALNAIMTRLATDTKDCATELAKYGVNIYDAEGNMQSLSSILEGVSEHWSTLTDQEQANLAKMIAGTNQYSALQTIMNGLSDSAEEAGMSFGDYAAALEKCDGAATDMSTTMIDNLQGDMTIFESAVDGMKLSLSEELNPALRDITQYVTKQMPNIENALKPVFKTAVGGLEFIIKNIPKAIDTAKKIIPVVTAIGAAFATIKIVDSIKKTTGAVEKLFAVVAANPFLAATAGVAALVTAIVTMKKESKAARDTMIDDMTAESRALSDSVQADIDKMKELNRTAREQTEVDLSKTYKTETLYKELQRLVDENGKVKKGYEDRVSYIVSELHEATGIEIQLIDGVIQKYGELQTTIQETIKKQRAQIFEQNYAEVYNEALMQNSQAASKLVQAQEGRNAAKAKLDSINSKVRAMFDEGGQYANAWFDYDALGGDITFENFQSIKNRWKNHGIFDNNNLEADLEAAMENYVNSTDTYRKEQDAINRNNYIIEQYEKAEEALANGNFSLAQGLFAGIDKASIESYNKSKDNIDDLVEHYKEQIEGAGEELRTAEDNNIKYGKGSASAAITEMVDEMVKDGLDGSEILKTGIINNLSQIDHFDTEALKSFMAQTGVELGDILATTSWNEMSSALRSAVTQLYYDENKLIDRYSVNSPGDAALAMTQGWGGKHEFYATGGHIGIGQDGIIAEAGPELIRVMNGGVEITPLSRTATNTPVGAGGDTIINNFYNTVYADVDSNYDVDKLAEDLASAEKRVSEGLGL